MLRRILMLLAAATVVVMLAVAPAFANDDFEVCWNGDTISNLSYHDAKYLVDHTSATWGSCNNNNNNGGAFPTGWTHINWAPWP